jgi:ABC-type nitrate/sulfonate/bicarbonate transport system ATPase subunit
MLELRECAAGYGAGRVLDSLSLSVPEGETACIIGPSGCGKSTLLTVAAGLKRPESGTVLLDGKEVVPGDERVGLILQQYGLFPWFTVADNVSLGLRIRRVREGTRRALVARELARLGLEDCAGRYPNELSGGQQQRVAIARSMALSPRLLLMDEPFSALDAMSRESLQEILLSTIRERPLVVVMVTHSIEEAVYLGGTVRVLAGSPGRITALFENRGQGTPGFRLDPAFFRMCTRVRGSLEQNRVIAG